MTMLIAPSELPEVDADTANSDLGYLDGEGAPLLAMVGATEQATASGEPPDPAACTSLFEDLTAAGSPEELAALIRPLIDEALRSSLEATRSAAVALVASCEQEGDRTPTTQGDAGLWDPIVQGSQSAALFRQRRAQMEEEG